MYLLYGLLGFFFIIFVILVVWKYSEIKIDSIVAGLLAGLVAISVAGVSIYAEEKQNEKFASKLLYYELNNMIQKISDYDEKVLLILKDNKVIDKNNNIVPNGYSKIKSIKFDKLIRIEQFLILDKEMWISNLGKLQNRLDIQDYYLIQKLFINYQWLDNNYNEDTLKNNVWWQVYINKMRETSNNLPKINNILGELKDMGDIQK